MKFKNTILSAVLLLALSHAVGCGHISNSEKSQSTYTRGQVLVDVQKLSPQIQTNMMYLISANFLGRPVRGYVKPICYLTHQAAQALANVQIELSKQGYSLQVHDCYRPARAVADFVNWGKDLSDQKMKTQYYPKVDKEKLFELGYISSRSGHSRGSTVDLTIVKWNKKEKKYEPVDMGAPLDFFGEISHTDNPNVSVKSMANRNLLRNAMHLAGFKNYEKEWWHYTLINEPYPDTYFDFVVE